jgi:hypothetical protein
LFGICGGGGYSLAAAKTDKRFKSIADLEHVQLRTGAVATAFADSQLDTIQVRPAGRQSDARAQEMAGGQSPMPAMPT